MKNVLLIGLGRFGRHIAAHLCDLGHQVMAVDSDENRVNKVLPLVTNAQIGNSTDADFLRSLGVDNYDVCIVTIGGDSELARDCIAAQGARSKEGRGARRARCSGKIPASQRRG